MKDTGTREHAREREGYPDCHGNQAEGVHQAAARPHLQVVDEFGRNRIRVRFFFPERAVVFELFGAHVFKAQTVAPLPALILPARGLFMLVRASLFSPISLRALPQRVLGLVSKILLVAGIFTRVLRCHFSSPPSGLWMLSPPNPPAVPPSRAPCAKAAGR